MTIDAGRPQRRCGLEGKVVQEDGSGADCRGFHRRPVAVDCRPAVAVPAGLAASAGGWRDAGPGPVGHCRHGRSHWQGRRHFRVSERLSPRPPSDVGAWSGGRCQATRQSGPVATCGADRPATWDGSSGIMVAGSERRRLPTCGGILRGCRPAPGRCLEPAGSRDPPRRGCPPRGRRWRPSDIRPPSRGGVVADESACASAAGREPRPAAILHLDAARC